MARGVQFDFLGGPAKPTPEKRQVKAVTAEDVTPCTWCSDRIGPWWDEGPIRCCRACVPDYLRYPARFAAQDASDD